MRTKPYDGFPPELLDLNNENRVPNYESSTLPWMDVMSDVMFGEMNYYDIHRRDKSFHDDRALLPSQRRITENSTSYWAARSASFCF